jgi:hypothetical protein
MRVFMEYWQHECCGDLFAVGDAVTWPVRPVVGGWLAGMLRDGFGPGVRWTVERHNDEVTQLHGTVSAIRSVFHRLERVERDPEHPRSLPGSAVLQEVQCTGRTERFGDYEWAGYVVELSGADLRSINEPL